MIVFVTGTAGFIGFHLAKLLLDQGHTVHGYDGMTDYYDVRLKHARHDLLRQYPQFTATEAMLEDDATLQAAVAAARPSAIVHLAAQAGVRYSIDHPRTYIDANIIGSFNVMEAARRQQVAHLLMASTSSVYGANTDMPFGENQKCDTQMSFYAATKKANESMAHAWAHIHGVPITLFRFFTVYGPWGRPDMALFKFTKNILAGEPIDIYNHGDMWRDFTYVEDLVRAIALLIDAVPPTVAGRKPADVAPGDSLSSVAPWRVVNIGNSDKVRLLDFIDAIEQCLGKPAIRNYMAMQPGDVPATWADASLLQQLTGYRPQTSFLEGVRRFVDWYLDFHGHPD
jgi:UDP-glucuronate 4-epimerase